MCVELSCDRKSSLDAISQASAYIEAKLLAAELSVKEMNRLSKKTRDAIAQGNITILIALREEIADHLHRLGFLNEDLFAEVAKFSGSFR